MTTSNNFEEPGLENTINYMMSSQEDGPEDEPAEDTDEDMDDEDVADDTDDAEGDDLADIADEEE